MNAPGMEVLRAVAAVNLGGGVDARRLGLAVGNGGDVLALFKVGVVPADGAVAVADAGDVDDAAGIGGRGAGEEGVFQEGEEE